MQENWVHSWFLKIDAITKKLVKKLPHHLGHDLQQVWSARRIMCENHLQQRLPHLIEDRGNPPLNFDRALGAIAAIPPNWQEPPQQP
jgi:hypothetical protein